MKQFILESVKRFITKNPKYFRTLQIVMGVAFILCIGVMGTEKYFPELLPQEVNTMAEDAWSYLLILVAAFQIPNEDTK